MSIKCNGTATYGAINSISMCTGCGETGSYLKQMFLFDINIIWPKRVLGREKREI